MTEHRKAPCLPNKRQSLSQVLVAQLSSDIDRNVYMPGQKLPTELQLMDSYNVSRTVVREALSRLQASGLAETRHGIGTFVLASGNSRGVHIAPDTLRTLRDVIDLLELRACLEIEAAGLAALYQHTEAVGLMRIALDQFTQAPTPEQAILADFNFHHQIARATGNRYFIDIIAQFGPDLMPRARLNSAQLNDSDPAHTQARLVREHEDIYAAIARRDVQTARAAMRLHLTNSRERLRKADELAIHE